MGNFRFRMAKILKLREKAEQDASLALGEVLSRQMACRNHLATLDDNMNALLAKRNRLQQGRVVPSELAQNRYQIIVLERSQEMSRRRLLDLEREVTAARRILLERNKEKQLLEKLRERQGEEHRMEMERRERKELDDRPQPRSGMGIAKDNPMTAQTGDSR